MAFPSSQKADACPISFILDDQNDGTRKTLTLAIRPEDLSRTEPNRVSVVQTLGGAFVDNFGRGLPNISISGTTGWNRLTDGGPDGAERFKQLYDTVLTDWESRRKASVVKGLNPDNVRLIFADGLHNKVDVVVVPQFALRRNKSRPLLTQYQISMVALNLPVELGAPDPAENLLAVQQALDELGLASLKDSVAKVDAFVASLQDQASAAAKFLQEKVAPIQSFVAAAVTVMKKVQSVMGSVLRAVASVTTPLLNLATMIAKAGQQFMHGLGAVLSFPNAVKAQIMQVASAFTNMFCLLRNAFKRALNIRDFSDLYGSSNCSSTNGGRPLSPLSGVNPWEKLYPIQKSPVSISAPAGAALQRLADSDPVLAPLPTAQLLDAAKGFGGGVAVA